MYQPLERFSKQWIFKRNDPKVEQEDLERIHLLSEQRASQIWLSYISDEQIHPDHFTDRDWLKKTNSQLEITKVQWERTWDSDKEALPEDVLAHFSTWGEDTLVFFCCHNELVFELPWGVFKRAWKAFLFLDNGPVLVGKKKKQAAQFHSNGWVNLLLRES
ncbi:hypothetical protein MUS1_05800 [Marinomonas ushuaiensis DSM 15871]|uniref:DUF2947 domain-containing protein n=1 Tax=Marinomonas ushuaiensis DSM 15871 TaxID=1122207 RepID=X7E177_9GAMM|nr:DUF2947 family protein [Marinomonas ushuaiensis]ETX09829.1 hypothetical protein MUS1_05800 [Marinomonas ushuaiensis DSM 15871]